MGTLLVSDLWLADPENLWGLAQAVLAVGFVIFVHELGHFLVARACGVKCEKFYVGFDVGGISLWKKKIGETVYGIGLVPLGGYVKMLGQDDDPRKIAEENKRSQAGGSQAGADAAVQQTSPAPSPANRERTATLPAVKHDPRSYLAKSVPQRMAIISAGVIMNMIFAVIFAATAFNLGVLESPCQIGSVTAGGGAWKSGITPGDRVLQIGDLKPTEPLRFSDLAESVVLSDQPSVKFVLESAGNGPREIMVTPTVVKVGNTSRRQIGALSEHATTLSKQATAPGSVARLAKGLKPGWRITAVNDRPVNSHSELEAELTRSIDKDVMLTLAPPQQLAAGDSTSVQDETSRVLLPPEPWKELGIEIETGPIAAVRVGGAADKAGLREGDKIVSIAGGPIGDVLTLSQRLAKLGPTVTVEIMRGEERVTAELAQDDYPWQLPSLTGGQVGVPSLGLTLGIVNKIAAIAPDSAAEKAGLKAGDELISGALDEVKNPPADLEKWENSLLEAADINLEGMCKWEAFVGMVQSPYYERTVTLTVKTPGQEKARTVALTPRLSGEYFNHERGLLFEPLLEKRRAQSFGQSIAMGIKETGSRAMHVVKVLQSLVTGRISASNMGGPLTILATAAGSAKQGFTDLLMFLTFISANLAVLNILPIPVLDGGHLVFLAYEGVFRKPPGEKVIIALSLIGLALLLSLMLFVTFNDFSRFLFPAR